MGIPDSIVTLISLNVPPGTFHSDKQLSFAADGLVSSHFFRGQHDPIFRRALQQTRQQVCHSLYHEWRLHLAISLLEQLAHSCLKKSQRFNYVECGVGEGHTLLLAYNYFTLLLDTSYHELATHFLSGSFLLIDTFAGIDPSLVVEGDTKNYKTEAYFGATLDVIKERFSVLNDLSIIPRPIPDALFEIHTAFLSPSFLHIDMNHDVPERAALEFFLPRMRSGCILLDDYSANAHTRQRLAIDDLCQNLRHPLPINLPTGQAIIYLNS